MRKQPGVGEPAPIVVSACLAGIPCRYDGAAKPDPQIIAMVESGRAVPLCAEVLGGLPTPRPPAEIVGDRPGAGGEAVLVGDARVVTRDGEDVTEEFVSGAQRVVQRAQELGATRAILQDKSPSCGATRIYDGTFSATLIEGQGVLAAALAKAGITVEAHAKTRDNSAD